MGKFGIIEILNENSNKKVGTGSCLKNCVIFLDRRSREVTLTPVESNRKDKPRGKVESKDSSQETEKNLVRIENLILVGIQSLILVRIQSLILVRVQSLKS